MNPFEEIELQDCPCCHGAGIIEEEGGYAPVYGEPMDYGDYALWVGRYLDGNVGCAQYGGMSSLDSALRFWEDYLTAAEAMGYQLHRENVLLPRNLGDGHDNATGQHRAQLEQEQRIERERRRPTLGRSTGA